MTADVLLPASPIAPAAPAKPRPFYRPPVLSRLEVGVRVAVYGVIFAILVYVFSQVYASVLAAKHLEAAHLRIDLRPLINAAAIIQAHVAGAVTSFGLGIAIMMQRKGSRLHRKLGWTWSATMALTAGSSFFILEKGQFVWIHGLSGFTLVLLPMALAAARAHRAQIHARLMTTLFLGGMVTAGLFTFVPGRLMWRTFFGVDV